MCDWLSEGFPLVGVLEGSFVCSLGNAERLGRNSDPAVVEGIHGNRESISNALQDVLDRYFAVFEDEGACVRGTDTKFVFLFSNRETFVTRVDNERSGPTVLFDPVVWVVDILCKQDENFGLRTVGDPHFLAVEDVMLAIVRELCFAGHRRCICTGTCLRK